MRALAAPDDRALGPDQRPRQHVAREDRRGRACARRRSRQGRRRRRHRAVLARRDPLLRRRRHGAGGRLVSQGGRAGLRARRIPAWASSTTSASASLRTIATRSIWYRRAAEHGSAAGQRAVGRLLPEGTRRSGRRGGSRALVPARRRWRRYSRAISARRACTSTATGVPRDYASAYLWYSLAAGQAPLVTTARVSSSCATSPPPG